MRSDVPRGFEIAESKVAIPGARDRPLQADRSRDDSLTFICNSATGEIIWEEWFDEGCAA
jgi:hypothetical protein